MLVWATEFPAAQGKHAQDLLPIAKEWLVGSPHTEWAYEDFGDEPYGQVTRYAVGGQTVAIAKVAVDGQEWVALQHSWIENGQREWTTDIVAHENGPEVWVAVRLHCNLLQPGLKLPKPRKPFFVKLLLEKLGGGHDSLLPISDAPVRLQEDEVDLAAGLILGTAKNRLPTVYVSSGWGNRYSVDPDRLAKSLAGMAHVVVEPSRHFSFAVSRHVFGSNAYNGAISIYWPAGVGAQARFLPSKYESVIELERTIVEAIRTALTHIRPRTEATWSFVREMISRSRLEELKASGSTVLDEYLEVFDAEIHAKQQRLEEAEQEIRRLQVENQRLEGFVRPAAEGILTLGNEQEYYPGEIRDAVIHTVKAGRGALAPNSRWLHIIADLLDVNNPTQGREQISGEVKECLSKMTKFGTAERRALEDVGFDVSDAGKHIKAVYHGDDRYVFSIAKTPSDHRSGKNVVSDINRKIFG